MKNLQTQFFAAWKQYCLQARINSDESEAARREFLSINVGKSSWKELDASEKEVAIATLNRLIEKPAHTPENTPEQKQRRRIIAILCEEYEFRTMSGKADMPRINLFLKEKGKFKKSLNELKGVELTQTVTQMVIMQRNNQESRRKKMKYEN